MAVRVLLRLLARVESGVAAPPRTRPRPHSFSIVLLVAWLSATGCQGGYPIAATRCDEWCDQLRRVQCGDYDPAACVAGCESAGVGHAACADLVAQTLSCLKSKSDAQLACEAWSRTGEQPCLDEQTATLECGTHSSASPGAPSHD